MRRSPVFSDPSMSANLARDGAKHMSQRPTTRESEHEHMFDPQRDYSVPSLMSFLSPKNAMLLTLLLAAATAAAATPPRDLKSLASVIEKNLQEIADAQVKKCKP